MRKFLKSITVTILALAGTTDGQKQVIRGGSSQTISSIYSLRSASQFSVYNGHGGGSEVGLRLIRDAVDENKEK